MSDITQAKNQLEVNLNKLQKLKQNELVKEYLELMRQVETFEAFIKKEVATSGVKVEYFSVLDDSYVQFVPQARSKYTVDTSDVREKFGDQFIKESVDTTALKKLQEGALYLQDKEEKTLFATRRLKEKK